jgi:hypothetical protein
MRGFRSFPLAIPLAFLGALVLLGGLEGCRKKSTGDAPALFLVSFHESGRTDLYRDAVLTLEFSVGVDPGSVDPDTVQILGSDGLPVLGLYEVAGNIVRFNPVVDENASNPHAVPLNPYGFGSAMAFAVVLPGPENQPIKVLRSIQGRPLSGSFIGPFETGMEFTPRPNDPSPRFEPFDAAVFDTTNPPHTPQNPKGTLEEHDDVLTYSPVPNLANPPINPETLQPDFRAEHPTNVQLQLTFSSVIDPRTLHTERDGNLVLEYRYAASRTWYFIPTTASVTPNGRTVILTAATPLANQDRVNRYRVVIGSSPTTITGRGGRPLDAVVRKWDDTQKLEVERPVVEDDLTIWTRKQAGESGPLLTAVFPLEAFAQDDTESDPDVLFVDGRVAAGNVVTRTSEDQTPCTWAYCSAALREPLTQSTTSPFPNPNTKGPSKIQFHYNTFQHALNAPSPAWKLANAEALVGMNWGPLCNTVVKSTYPKMHIHVMWSDRNSTNPSSPAGLPSTTYNSNFDRNPPGFAVRDGSAPYRIDQSSANATWYPWKFTQPFTDYRIDRGLVFMLWTEAGGDVEQYLHWYSPGPTPNTRIFSPPSTTVDPAVGSPGQFCYYWTQFEFKRMRSLAVSKFYRMTANAADRPDWRAAVVAPLRGNLPGGTDYTVEFRGGEFTSYVRRTAHGHEYWEGVGTPTRVSAFSTRVGDMDEYPAVAIRVTFTANIDRPLDLPYLEGLAFTFWLD